MSNAIVFLCHPYHRGGVTAWMISAAHEAARSGVEVYFVTVTPSKPFISGGNRQTMKELVDAKQFKNLKVIAPKAGYEFELGSDDYRSLIYCQSISGGIPLNTPIIVSDDASVWKAAAMLSDRYPMIAVLHSDDEHYYQLAHQYQDYVSSYVSVSSRVAQKAKLPPQKKSVVIPCGIEVDQYSHLVEETNKDRIQITWIGRIEEKQKRVSDIPLVAEELDKKGLKYLIKVAGTGPELDWLKDELLKKKLNTSVELLGWKSSHEIKQLLASSDLLLQTSNFEGMSVAVMEALASGCSVVSSRVSGVEDYEFSKYSDSCLFLYGIGEIEVAASQIFKAVKIDSKERMGAAVRFAADFFSIKECILKYKEFVKHSLVVEKPLLLSRNSLVVKLHSQIMATLRILKYTLSSRGVK